MNGDLVKLLQAAEAGMSLSDILWQLLVMAVCLVIAAFIARLVRRVGAQPVVGTAPDSVAMEFGRAGILRVAFPVAAVLLVFIARAIVKTWIPINLINVAVPLMMSMAAVRMVVYVLRHAFSHSRWLAASERVVATLAWTAVALYLTGLSVPIISALEAVQFKLGREQVDLWMVLHGIFMIVVTILVALWLSGLIEGRLSRTEIDSSIRVVLGRISKALLTLLALLLSLSMVGIDITALSVFGGALGVGLGFGLQKIASNYVSGFIILLDRSIRLGDMIAIDGGQSGVVTRITTRYTVVRTLSGIEAIVPNENLVSSVVQNQSYTDTHLRLSTRVQVAYRTDVDALIPAIVELTAQHPRVLADPAPVVRLINFADNGLELEVGFWIADPEEGSSNVRSDINLAILRLFRERGIEIPYPQREVRMLAPS